MSASRSTRRRAGTAAEAYRRRAGGRSRGRADSGNPAAEAEEEEGKEARPGEQ